MTIDPALVEALRAGGLGFAAAGLAASGFELATNRRASFALLQSGGLAALMSVPLLIACAPFIILRNTLRGRRFERRSMALVMAATVIACLWSILCGRAALDLAARLAGA